MMGRVMQHAGMRMGCMLHGLDFSSGCACMCMQVHCAINRATKEKRVAELEEALRNSTVAFGVRFNKVSVRAMLTGLGYVHTAVE